MPVRLFDLRTRLDDLVVGVRERDPDAAFFVMPARGEAARRDAFGQAKSYLHLDGGVVILEESVDLK